MKRMQHDISGPGYAALQKQERLERPPPETSHALGEALRTAADSRPSVGSYQCLKCGHGQHERREMRVAQSFWEGFFNLASGRYTALICTRCRFAEFYYGEADYPHQTAEAVPGG